MASNSQKSSSSNISYNKYKSNKAYRRQLAKAEKGKPTYTNQYKNVLASALNDINNNFEFDAANSPVYQAYANDYRLLGNIAADQNAYTTEELSGGFGTTYSGDVASQQLEGYLAGEKNIIPALYQQERANYLQDQANAVNKASLYSQLEQQDYNRFLERLNAWNQNRDYYYNKWLNDYLSYSTSVSKGTNSSSQTSTREVASGGRRGKSLNANKTKNYRSAADYLIDKGYGDKLDDLMTRQEYVTERATKDRDYNAGYTGLSKSDPDYAYKKSVEDKVDVDYSGYLYNYIKNKLKGKK